MPRFPFHSLKTAAFLATAAGLLSSCEDGPSKAVLERRIERLQTEVDTLKRKNEEAQDFTDASSTQLKDLVMQAQQRSQDALDQAGTAINQQKTRFERLENSLSSVLRVKEQSESMAYLDPTKPGHRPVETGHGPFLIRLEGLEPDPLRSRFVAKLSIGNPNGLMIQEFSLKGDFGEPAPELKPAEPYSEYSERLDAWQKSRTPFEEAFVQLLAPSSWTKIDLPLNTGSRDQLKQIRVTMNIRRAHLDSSGSEPEYSVINADSKGASLVKTDYGPLLVAVHRMEVEGTSTRLYISIGNPFGFVINEATLKGEFGPAPPRQMESETADLFRARLQSWSEQMAPFEATLTGNIAPLRWSEVTFSVPTTDRSRISYIRTQMGVTNITLPKSP